MHISVERSHVCELQYYMSSFVTKRLATYNDPDRHIAAQAGRHCVCILLDNIQHYPEQVCLPNRRLSYKDASSGETTVSGVRKI